MTVKELIDELDKDPFKDYKVIIAFFGEGIMKNFLYDNISIDVKFKDRHAIICVRLPTDYTSGK